MISKERGEALAKEFQIQFFEASAKENINVTEIFETTARICMSKKPRDEPSTGLGAVRITAKEEKKKKSCCG